MQLVPKSPTWRFARIIIEQDGPQNNKVETLQSACKVTDPTNSFFMDINMWQVEDWSLLRITEGIRDGFRKIGKDKLEKDFDAKLSEIKKNPDALQRVKATYEFVIKSLKPYDDHASERFDAGERPLVYTPEETLHHEAVCRDYARLLKWALLQVAQPSSGLKGQSFSASIETAYNKEGTRGHAWVSVNLPMSDSAGSFLGTERIDLDPTNFPDKFTPLMPLGQMLPQSRIKEYDNICSNLVDCLNKPEPVNKTIQDKITQSAH